MRRRRFRCEGRNQKYQTASTMSAGTRKLRLTSAMSGAKITATTSNPDAARRTPGPGDPGCPSSRRLLSRQPEEGTSTAPGWMTEPSAPSASGAAWPTGGSAACSRHVVREQGKVGLANSQISELESLFVLHNPSVDKQQDCRDLDSNANKDLLVAPIAGHAEGPRAESDEHGVQDRQ